MIALSINNLSKSYGRIKAVQGLNLEIEEGTIYGLLGPNGSGKTTTLGMILDIIKPDQGTYQWFEGKYGDYHRKKVGAILETPNFYPYLDATENLKIVDQIKGGKRNNFDDLLELVNLLHRKKSKFRAYSLGMKQRLAIAATLLGDPEVLIFDEPTNGLDPQGIAEVRNVMTEIASMGKTVLLASHILHEVEKICDHVAIIKNGKLLATGLVGSILSDDITIEVGSHDLDQLATVLSEFSNIENLSRKNTWLECTIPSDTNVEELNKFLFSKGIVTNHFVSRKRKLEEEFLEITKE
ncbi:MAG: ATP-binding cassette domain-containing protein [Saprospiraceae bacterium]|nr:ATP-binding cassette domain-containing protein [Saprospiraceae bacterium]|tara:strand:+ start:1087 stop:1974 length:888 start_codon:yes stop_codon:yes gene_type:complete